MGSKNCMNEICLATTSLAWKKGWRLKSGGFATLCVNCGSAYESSVFCETFHSDESGWRECRICGKLIHCGCIASRYLYEFMDFGGIGCGSCAKHLGIQSVQTLQIPSDLPNGNAIPTSDGKDARSLVLGDRINDDKFSTERLLQLTKAIRVNSIPSAFEQHKHEEPVLKTPESSTPIPNLSEPYSPTVFVTSDRIRPQQGPKDAYEPLAHPPLIFSLSTPSSTPSTLLPFHGKNAEGSEQSKVSFQHRQKARHGFPKPPKPSPGSGPETSKGAISQIRVPRPPAEGRGRNQLLPRYWPRITEQELQQLSGDLKSTIVPLFEKILSASDAGRIGRLVLPKACAETYFPTINQSEGIPIAIQDVKGKEWTFQFRFWPNNNSRMYVLEGVTPCIQNMQLQAGDTVIFSRREPGDQLVIGCRKATNNGEVQEKSATVPAGDSPSESLFSCNNDNLPSNGARPYDDSVQHSEKKKSKNIKNKRLLMHNDDAMELRITWEEAQELFRPSSSSQPTVVVVEGHEFEEFEEPPIFGKRTMFISQSSGEPEQLAQCDHCLKWRRVPVHALLSANWTCSDNIWDSGRCSCSAPEEINRGNFGINSDNKKRRILESKLRTEGEPSGLDALATAAVLGDNISEIGESSTGPTTRHPRHRPGCTCIVCIQPPSGKGKHESTCKCNVCLTVRRRFKTLMMRKKKKQSEREAEEKERSLEKLERVDTAGHALLNMNQGNKTIHGENDFDLEETGKGRLDLNCDPHHEDEILAVAAGMSLTTLISAATFPLDMHMTQNGIPVPETGHIVQSKGVENIVNVGNLASEDARQENHQGEG